MVIARKSLVFNGPHSRDTYIFILPSKTACKIAPGAMTHQESPIIKLLRDRFQAISKQQFAREIIFNIGCEVESALMEAFPDLARTRLFWTLSNLHAAGELPTALYKRMDRLRLVFNSVKHYARFIPTERQAEGAVSVFQSFIDWLHERQSARPEVRVNNLWYEHNVRDDYGSGMLISLDFEVDNMRGRTGTVIVNFHYDDKHGELLNLRVYEDGEFTPRYAYASYKKFSLFLPYTWLADAVSEDDFYDDPRDCEFKFYIEIRDDRHEALSLSSWRYFTL